MKLRIGILFLFLSQLLHAQQCNLEHIENLLRQNQFALAYSECERFNFCENRTGKQTERVRFLQALSAFELFNDEAEFRLKSYLIDYPFGSFRNQARLMLSKFHYRNKNYSKAVEQMNLVSARDLNTDEEAMFYFRLGYSYFELGQFENAQWAFFDLKTVKFTYTDLMTYCLGHIAYEEGNYATALIYFEDLLETPKLGIISSYYISHIYYYQRRYQDLIDFALPLLEKQYNAKRDKELLRLLGNAYYGLKKYKQSISYFDQYQLTDNTLERTEKFHYAEANYYLQNYDKAVGSFEELLTENDSLSQFAAHKLAKTYLKLDEKLLAINAFRYASSFNFDYAIKEDAAFNEVKLVCEVKNSLEDEIEKIEFFIDDYPLSIHLDYVKSLLIKAYTSTKNYKIAEEKLSELKTLSFEQKQAYQKLNYLLALQSYIRGDFSNSINRFEKALEYDLNPNISVNSQYWLAEAHYQLGQYSDAIQHFKTFQMRTGAYEIKEFSESHYSLAYAHFKLNNFSQSITWFRKYVKKTKDNNRLTDAYLRLGDAYYMTRDFNRSNEYYKQAEDVGSFDIDYSLYQQSICLGLIQQLEKKQSILNRLIIEFPNSIYHDDALLSLSNIYLNNGKENESLQLLFDLIENHPNSPLIKKATLNIGLNYYNDDKLDFAVEQFKKVIEGYPNSTEAKEALVAFKNLSVESGDVSNYFNYIDRLSNVVVEVASKDSISYEAAENLYLNQDYDRAIPAFNNYFRSFEEPIFKLNAHFYRAECLQTQSPEASIEDYIFVIEYPNNEFTERALNRLSSIEFERKEYGVAALHYTMLLEIAQDNTTIREATLKLFKCYLNLDILSSKLEFAQKVLDLEKVSLEIQSQARLIIANNYFDSGEINLSKKEYTIISEQTNADVGAEAKYQLAYISFLEDDYVSSESAIFELSEKFYSDYFIAKAFILLADIYLVKNNYFQSKATLQSVIDNYKGDDELVGICKQKIEEINTYENQLNQPLEKDNLIIDLLNDVELYELFEEEIIEDE